MRPAARDTIQLTDRHGQLAFTVNGKDVGHTSDLGTFKSGEVWVGASTESPNGSFVISKLTARPLDAGESAQSVNTAHARVVPHKSDGLQALATKNHKGLLIGAAMALAPLASDRQYREAALSTFGSMTTENALKWQFTEPEPGVYDLSEARAMVDVAQKNHLAVHGHTLVFSEALPQWVQQLPTDTPRERAYVQRVMTDHITYLVSHLPQIASWDVVDEPIADYASFAPQSMIYRENVFYRAMGPGYIRIALEAAHRANPTAKLYVNDYGDEIDTSDRWNATYDLLKQLKHSGVPLDGFGFESHIYDPQTDAIVDKNGEAPTLERHIDDLAALGLRSRISEMDVDNGKGTAWQAQQFAGVLKTCIKLWPRCVSFTVWGVSDRYDMWQTESHQLQYGHDLLLDSAMQPTASYVALERVLGGTRRRAGRAAGSADRAR
jgi:endo-1,4-beta-xylanase